MGRAAAAVAAIVATVLLASCSAGATDDVGHVTGPAPATRTSATPATSQPATPAPDGASVVANTTPNPCRHNAHGKLVKVSLHAQHLWMCRATHVVHDTAITSGIVGQYTHTPTGHFRIQGLERNQVLTLIDGQQFTVKYWIPFDAPLFGFHDASWQKFAYGSKKYRTHGSHGCVHMPLHAIATLYHWAHVGTRVHIHR